MWYIAARIRDEHSLSLYVNLKSWLQQQQNIAASVYRIQPDVIVIAGENQPEPSQTSHLFQALTRQGTLVKLNEDVLYTLVTHRQQNLAKAKLSPSPSGRAMLYSESHRSTSIQRAPSDWKITNLAEQENLAQTAMVALAKFNHPRFVERLMRLPRIIAFAEFEAAYHEWEWEQQSVVFPYRDEKEKASAIRMVAAFNRIHTLRLQRANAYIFEDSAIQFHRKIFPQASTFTLPHSASVWIELATPDKSPYAEMWQLFFYDAYPTREIEEAISHLPVNEQAAIADSFSGFRGQLGLQIIDEYFSTTFDFTYDVREQAWVFPPSHHCPYNTCQYFTANGVHCEPCTTCKEACDYYARWLITALRMVNGEYTPTPDEPSFPRTSQAYETTERQTVGKGKNKRSVPVTVKKKAIYTVVKYNILEKPRALTEEETRIIEQEARRANWLKAVAPDDIIWIRQQIPSTIRRYPLRRDGSRRDGWVKVPSFIRRTPHLRFPSTHRITSVSAQEDADRQQ